MLSHLSYTVAPSSSTYDSSLSLPSFISDNSSRASVYFSLTYASAAQLIYNLSPGVDIENVNAEQVWMLAVVSVSQFPTLLR